MEDFFLCDLGTFSTFLSGGHIENVLRYFKKVKKKQKQTEYIRSIASIRLAFMMQEVQG